MGRLSRQPRDRFTDSAAITLTQVSLNAVEGGEQRVRRQLVLRAGATAAPGDFNEDGRGDFTDFFLFSDRFGLLDTDARWDAAYDLRLAGQNAAVPSALFPTTRKLLLIK